MTGGHLDATLLAEYDEGLLAAPEAGEIEAHLAGCPACARTLHGLGAVTEALRSAPVSVPAPAQVVARLDEAFAAEQAARTESERTAPIVAIHPIRRRLPHVLGIAATIAVVGFVVQAGLGGSGNDSDVSSTAGGDAGTEAVEDGAAADEQSGDDLAPADKDGVATAPEAARASGLADQIRAVAEARSAGTASEDAGQLLSAGCGEPLAAELDRVLLGAASAAGYSASEVLVVVATETPDVVQGWVVPACDSVSAEALTDLTVAVG
ncbi:MAG: anti-sigma factor family protein [Jiangellaceae bacterium]